MAELLAWLYFELISTDLHPELFPSGVFIRKDGRQVLLQRADIYLDLADGIGIDEVFIWSFYSLVIAWILSAKACSRGTPKKVNLSFAIDGPSYSLGVTS